MKIRALFAAVGLLLGAAGVQAHHAFATEFDVERPVELHGVVSKFEMINPHSWIHIDVVGEDGQTHEWLIEGGSPNALLRRGITKASVPIGSELHVFGYQARDGGFRAVGRTITFADGTSLFLAGTKIPDEAQPAE
jgi:Family of unknown function (DUF6152)